MNGKEKWTKKIIVDNAICLSSWLQWRFATLALCADVGDRVSRDSDIMLYVTRPSLARTRRGATRITRSGYPASRSTLTTRNETDMQCHIHIYDVGAESVSQRSAPSVAAHSWRIQTTENAMLAVVAKVLSEWKQIRTYDNQKPRKLCKVEDYAKSKRIGVKWRSPENAGPENDGKCKKGKWTIFTHFNSFVICPSFSSLAFSAFCLINTAPGVSQLHAVVIDHHRRHHHHHHYGLKVAFLLVAYNRL